MKKLKNTSTPLNKVFLISIVFLLIFTLFIPLTYGKMLSGNSKNDIPKIDKKTQAAIIDSVSAALNEVYVFPEVANNMEKLIRKNLKNGNYKKNTSISEFTEVLTKDLQSISHDKHLSVRALPPQKPGEEKKVSPEEKKKQELLRYQNDNFGFKKIEILPGNIGYIDFRYFTDATMGGGTAIAAMNFLAYADAIIFDLRQNGGGSPSMIQLISSYLFKEPVHLNSFYIRKSDKMKQFWTQSWVEGSKMTKIHVYI